MISCAFHVGVGASRTQTLDAKPCRILRPQVQGPEPGNADAPEPPKLPRLCMLVTLFFGEVRGRHRTWVPSSVLHDKVRSIGSFPGTAFMEKSCTRWDRWTCGRPSTTPSGFNGVMI